MIWKTSLKKRIILSGLSLFLCLGEIFGSFSVASYALESGVNKASLEAVLSEGAPLPEHESGESLEEGGDAGAYEGLESDADSVKDGKENEADSSKEDGKDSTEETGEDNSEDNSEDSFIEDGEDKDEDSSEETDEDALEPDDLGGKSGADEAIKAEDLLGGALGITMDDPGTVTCGSPTTFTVHGNGGTEPYKYRLHSLTTVEGNETVQIYDVSANGGNNSKYQTDNTFQFTFYASGTYQIRFDVFDASYGYKASPYYTITINDPDYPSITSIVEQVKTQCLSTVGEGADDYTKALFFNDWLVRHSKYDWTYSYCSSEGVLARGTGTCESYHRAFVMMLNSVGIETSRVEGNGHVWTGAKLDGNWYQIDTTWNDVGDDYNTYLGVLDLERLYFGLTDEMMTLAHSDHHADASRSCVSLEDNYYIRSGDIHLFSDVYLDEMKAHFAAGEGEFSIDEKNASWPESYRNVINYVVAYQLSQEDFSEEAVTELSVTYEDNKMKVSAVVDPGDVEPEDLPGDDTMTLAQRKALIPKGFWVSEIEPLEYTGKSLKPEFRVYYGKYKLIPGEDYTVRFSNNVRVGTGQIAISGLKGYSGRFVKSFSIVPRDISEQLSGLENQIVCYDARRNQSPKIEVIVAGRKLTSSDYSYVIQDSLGQELGKSVKNPGTYTVTVTAKGNYSGTGSFSFRILEQSLVAMQNVKVGAIAPVCYTGAAITLTESQLKVTCGKDALTRDVDYTVTYLTDPSVVGNNTTVGTAKVLLTGTGTKYYGTKTVTFEIRGLPLSRAKIAGLNSGDDYDKSLCGYVYRGTPYEPGGPEEDNSQPGSAALYYTSADGSMVKLTKGVDYTVRYITDPAKAGNNISAGTAKIQFIGMGAYTGSITGSFRIVPYDLANDFYGDAKIGVTFLGAKDGTERTYLYQKGGVSPEVKVTFGGDDRVLVKNKDYRLSYENNYRIRDAVSMNAPMVVITGQGNFKGRYLKIPFEIAGADLGSCSMTANDIVATGKAGVYQSAVTITDTSNGKAIRLIQGKDYKNLQYTYACNGTITRSSVWGNTSVAVADGDPVRSVDIIQKGIRIRVSAEGTGGYSGSLSTTYRASAYDISAATFVMKDQYYSGREIRPGKAGVISAKMKIGTAMIDLSASDYEIVSYSRNQSKGTGIMRIHGIGNYSGYKNVAFKIVGKSMFSSVLFESNGGTGTMKKMERVSAGAKLTKNAFSRKGYTFEGWNTAADGSGVAYENGSALSALAPGEDLVLYAQWTPIVYHITYELNGGSGNGSNPDTYTIETPTIVLSPGTYEGKWKHLGWYSDQALTKQVTSIPKGSTGDIKLYADWIEDFTVVTLGTQSHTAAEVRAYIESHPVNGNDTYAKNPSFSGTISPGVLSNQTLKSSENAVNIIRYIAGLDEIQVDSTLSYHASAGTLLDYMNSQLSHYPSRPGSMKGSQYDTLYEDGSSKGAACSNIAWTSWSASMNYAIGMWMDDGDSYNISRVGHRRWILNPKMGKIGFGRTGNYYAMYAFDRTNTTTSISKVAWPCENTTMYYKAGSPWSVSLGRTVDNSQKIKIVITNKKTGAKWKGSPRYVENSYYGLRGCLIFTPSVSTAAGSSYSVSVFTYDTEEEIQYDVSFM